MHLVEELALAHNEDIEVREPLDGHETSVAAVKFESLLLLKISRESNVSSFTKKLKARHSFKSSCVQKLTEGSPQLKNRSRSNFVQI